MRIPARYAFTAALALCAPAAMADDAACGNEAAMRGMRERIEALRSQMDRIEWMQDREQQKQLMDLHMKQMREGMGEIRRRDLGPACRMEMMSDMMEVMIRHQHAMHEPGERH